MKVERAGGRHPAVPLGLLLVGLLVVAAQCRPADVPVRRVIELQGMAFVPAVLTVAPGDTVVWINRDIVPHTATSDSAGGWDTGPVTSGNEGMTVVTQRGEFSYHCLFHPTMQGRLIVR